MSILAQPKVIFAIVFGCFAVLLPRVFLPLLRSKPSVPSHNLDDRTQRPPSPMPQGDTVEHISGTPPHMRGGHPSMRMHHAGANNRQQSTGEQSSSKSIVTLALPMYTVGIGVFFVYTCCKYWSKKNPGEKKQNNNHLQWNGEKRKIKYDILNNDSENEENKEDFYAELDTDYVEFLKTKKQRAIEAERVMSDEQRQMHYALEEMKKSLSFISSKLVTKESRDDSIDGSEINLLQDRLASTEAQMCKILTALDSASDKVNKLTKIPNQSQKTVINKEEIRSLSRSSNESDLNDEENSNDEENPFHRKEQIASVDNKEESSSSSYEESDRYGVMDTDYGGDPAATDDHELNANKKSGQWAEHDRSRSLSSSSNSSIEQDQSAPIYEQNRLTKRKC